jgi:hypothetical protein
LAPLRLSPVDCDLERDCVVLVARLPFALPPLEVDRFAAPRFFEALGPLRLVEPLVVDLDLVVCAMIFSPS